jgi:hypothetical protein
MRKIITLVVATGLVLGAFAAPSAQAAKKKPKARTATANYEGPAVGVLGAGVCFPGTLGCFGFGTAATEHNVEVVIEDSAGTPVYASVTQDLNGDNQADTSTGICGASDGPIPIEAGYEVTVFIWEGPGPSPVCAGAATSGTITAKFTK